MAGNPLFDDRDVALLIDDAFDLPGLTALPYFADHDRTTFAAVLDGARRVAREVLAPGYRAIDAEPPRLEAGRIHVHPTLHAQFRTLRDLDLIAAPRPAAVGGQQLPLAVFTLATAYLMAGNAAAYAYLGLTQGAAHLLEAFGDETLRATYMAPMYRGTWTGTMALTEPQAGSSLADVATVARPTADGHYLLTGAKIFISGGDHDLTDNVVHLTLARIAGAPPGIKGVSLFCVPRPTRRGRRARRQRRRGGRHDPQDRLARPAQPGAVARRARRLPRLAGRRAAPGHPLHVPDDERGPADGRRQRRRHRVGRLSRGRGLRARAAAGSAADRQGPERAAGRDHRSRRRPPHVAPPARDRGRRPGAAGADRALRRPGRPRRRRRRPRPRRALLDLLTPIAKSFPAERGFEANALAVQIHGGYGYSSEYPVEAWLRDQKLNSIHEGTTGIQALDLLGRRAVAGGGAALAAWRAEVETHLRPRPRSTA
jgi:alkylation response protein AidB-like acyl-CoA dehydrogenase